jgi:hypothetical protein
MRRVIAVSLSAWLVGQTLPQGAAAEPARVADPISRRAEVLLLEMVSVTGTLRSAAQPQRSGAVLELDSGAMGRYRIDEHGLGAELKRHVGEAVSVVAFVEPSEDPERPLLHVERFTIREGG